VSGESKASTISDARSVRLSVREEEPQDSWRAIRRVDQMERRARTPRAKRTEEFGAVELEVEVDMVVD